MDTCDQLVPALLFLRFNQPHHNLIQHRGFRTVRQFDLLA
jgi:hypothetical protein